MHGPQGPYISTLIDGCKSIKQLYQIHAHLIVSPDPTREVPLHLRRLLLICSATAAAPAAYAAALFRRIPSPPISAYNSLLRALARSPHTAAAAFPLYVQMLRSGVRPDVLTFPFVLKACARAGEYNVGRGLHEHVLKFGFRSDLFVGNVLIRMYSVFGDLMSARKVFDEMVLRDVVSWNSMITGCLRVGELDEALYLFEVMGEKNIISWNSVISGLAQGGRPGDAIAIFHEMLLASDGSGVAPEGITLASVITACGLTGALEQGKWVHQYLGIHGIELDLVIGTALVDMYGKCGLIERAVRVFNSMVARDVLAWTAMIKVFADHGLGKEALWLLDEMVVLGVKPNEVTFVALFCACAHSGLVERGRWVFNSMKNVYHIEPMVEHYACMVDLLGRAGLFGEALELIRSMAMAPDVYVWGSLLGACRMHGNVDLGEKVGYYLIDSYPLNHAFYVSLYDIYANAHMFKDAKRIRALMRERGISKQIPGCSVIEINGVVYEFSVQGSVHVMMEQIEWVLWGFASEWSWMNHNSVCLSGGFI